MKNKKIFADIKQIIILMWIINFVFVLLSFIFDFSFKVLLGFLIGCIYASLSMFFLGVTVQNSVDKTTKGAKAYMMVSLILRYGVFVVIFAVCYYKNLANIFTLLLPLFYPKIAMGIRFLILRKEGIE